MTDVISFSPGIEKEFDQRLMPDGKCNIDGFLCVFDVSIVPNRTLEKQVNTRIIGVNIIFVNIVFVIIVVVAIIVVNIIMIYIYPPVIKG